MAITHVGKSSALASGTGAISVGVPSGVAQGDLLLLITVGYDAIPGTPSGWTSIDTQTNTKAFLRVSYKVAGSSESAVSVADSGDSTRGLMVAFRNAAYQTTGKSTSSGTSYSAATPSTTQNGSMVVYCIGFWDADANDTANYSSQANSDLASITLGHDETTNTGSGGGLAYMYGIDTTAGTIGSATATTDSSANTSATIVVVLNETIAAAVTAVIATGTAAGIVPTLDGAAAVTGVIATATMVAVPPDSVIGLGGASPGAVTAVITTATGAGIAPGVKGDAAVTAIIASATAAGIVPGVKGDAAVTAVIAAATAAAIAPDSVIGLGGGGSPGAVTAVIATATGAGIVPSVDGVAAVTAVVAAATDAGIAPSVKGSAAVTAVIAASVLSAIVPDVTAASPAAVTVVPALLIIAAYAPRVTVRAHQPGSPFRALGPAGGTKAERGYSDTRAVVPQGGTGAVVDSSRLEVE